MKNQYDQMFERMSGNAKSAAASVISRHDMVHDVCIRNGLGANDAKIILDSMHRNEVLDRQFSESLKRELSVRGVKLS